MAVSAQDNRVLDEEDFSYIQGVLRVEVKDASKLYDSEHQEGPHRLHVEITVQGRAKRTRSVLTRGEGEVGWGQTKLVPVHVPRQRRHADNLLAISIVSHPASHHGQGNGVGRTVGSVGFHLHDVVKQSPVDGVFDLFSSYQTTGEIRLSLSFSYGLFGYGYSSQLKEDNFPVDHFLKYSLFPRIDPIVTRLDPNKHILVPKASRHPLFIPFNQRVHIGFGQEIASTLDNIQDTSGKFSLLGQNMGRFEALQEQLKREPSRADRLAFLGNLILDSNKKVEAIKEGVETAEHAKRDPFLNPGFLTLSADEMKDRGLLVASLPKEAEKEKAPEAETNPTTVPSTAPSSSSPSTSSSSSLTGTPSRGRASSSVVSLSPLHSHSHSGGTPLLSSHPSTMKLTEGSPANPHIQRLKNL